MDRRVEKRSMGEMRVDRFIKMVLDREMIYPCYIYDSLCPKKNGFLDENRIIFHFYTQQIISIRAALSCL